MRTRTIFSTGAILALSFRASALVKPPEGTALPNYDVRATGKGLVMGLAPGRMRALHGGSEAPSAEKASALARLESVAGKATVTWNPLNGTPSMLFRYEGPLTAPQSGDAGLIARNFLAAYADLFGLEPSGLSSFQETRRFTTKGDTLTVLHLEQFTGGLNVYQGDVRFAITPRGEVASVSSTDIIRATSGLNLTPVLDADGALIAAARGIGVEDSFTPVRSNPASEKVALYEKGPFRDVPRVEAVLFPMGASARIAYKVIAGPAGASDIYETVVDGTDGTLLFRYDATQYIQTHGLVFPTSPKVDPVQVDTPFPDDTVMFDKKWPLGWVTPGTKLSAGNVVDAKEDRAGDNEALPLGNHSRDQNPDAPVFFEDSWGNSYATANDPIPDQFAAITNLFYFANAYHDWVYVWGFDEAAGNWQETNFNRGGKEGDRLYADAQDSWALPAIPGVNRDNANMATLQDGISPRAQFFLFSSTKRDPDVDSDVVFHEMTHGVSNRLMGGANSGACFFLFQSAAMGEGWSDFFAIHKNNDDVLGEYVTGNMTSGIRSAAYGSYPPCHKFNGAAFCPNGCGGFQDTCEIHDEGELWAATLWEMRTDIGDPDVAFRLVMDGLKLTPCNPTFLQARDAILLADQYDYAGAHQCQIWMAFSQRDMGWGATTANADDTNPVGDPNTAPYCQNNGRVILNLDRYACTDTLIATVEDTATGNPTVRLTTTAGDTYDATATGVGPIYQTPAIAVVPGVPTADNILQVVDGDIITATYNDTGGSGITTAMATVSCKALTEHESKISGGCSADSLSGWPVPLPQILDAGEIVDFTLVVYNREHRPLTNARLTLTGISDPMVALLSSATVTQIGDNGTIPAYTGAGSATFKLAASRFLAAGLVTLDFKLEADGFTDAQPALSVTIPVTSNYRLNANQSLGVETLEASDGSYTKFGWPGSGSVAEWNYGVCAAASGTKAWHAGNPACSGNAAEQDAVLQTRAFNPTSPTRVSWYPVALNFNERLDLAPGSPGDEAVIWLVEPNFWFGGSYAFSTEYGGNTGGNFRAQSFSFTGADTLGARIENEKGLMVWFDFFTLVTPAPSVEWSVDDVEMRVDAADADPDTAPPSCLEAGYWGTLSSCVTAHTTSLYNTLRPTEMQFVASGGRFWEQSQAWNCFDSEFPTPTLSGEILVLLANANPGGGGHQGVMAVDGRPIADPKSAAFANPEKCAPIPVPTAQFGTVASGQPIRLSWTPFVESGPVPSIVGYNVYRLDAELFPAATSTISDYVAAGPIGDTVGKPDINQYMDVAPPLQTPQYDRYSYAIQPLFRCEGTGCTPVPATFGGDETTAGTANLSGDSIEVRVSAPLLATFVNPRAERRGSTVVVTWMTSSEIDTLGFDVYRGSSDDEAGLAKVNQDGRIKAHGIGKVYTYVDSNPPAGRLFYQVREVSLNSPSRTAPFELSTSGGGDGGRTGSGRRRGAGAGNAATGSSLKVREERAR